MDFPGVNITIEDSNKKEDLFPDKEQLTTYDLKLIIDKYLQKEFIYKQIDHTTLAQIRYWGATLIIDEAHKGRIPHDRYKFVCEAFPRVNKVEWNVIDLWGHEEEEYQWKIFIEDKEYEWGGVYK